MSVKRGVSAALPLFVWGGLLFAPVSWRTMLACLVAVVVLGAVDYRWHGEDARKDKDGKTIPARDPDPRMRFSKPLFFTALMAFGYSFVAWFASVNSLGLAWWVFLGMIGWPSLWWWAVIALDWEPKQDAPEDDREKDPVIRRKSGINALPIGRDMATNTVYRLPFDPGQHTLVVGQTRSGKSGLIWAITCCLLPYQKKGEVEMYGIDPKLGMEMCKASWVFKELIFETEEDTGFRERVVEHMEWHVGQMKMRGHKARARGLDNLPPSVEFPMQVIYIDELLDMTLLMSADLKKRFDLALIALLTQGGALGYQIVGLTQNARKEVLDLIRDFFVNVIGLSLPKSSDVDVAFGADVRKEYGIKCDKIHLPAGRGEAYIADRGYRRGVHLKVDHYPTARINSFRSKYGTYDDKVIVGEPEPVEVGEGVEVERGEYQRPFTFIERVADVWPTARRRDPGRVHVDDLSTLLGMPVSALRDELEAVGIVPEVGSAGRLFEKGGSAKLAVSWPQVEEAIGVEVA